jgi:hypothetical protein
MPKHMVKVKLKNNNQAVPEPRIEDLKMKTGDIVQYDCDDGKLRIAFLPPLVSNPEKGKTLRFTDGSSIEILEVNPLQVKLLTKGKFQCQCFITPRGQTTEVGWSTGSPNSGGDHVVDL